MPAGKPYNAFSLSGGMAQTACAVPTEARAALLVTFAARLRHRIRDDERDHRKRDRAGQDIAHHRLFGSSAGLIRRFYSSLGHDASLGTSLLFANSLFAAINTFGRVGE